MLCRECTWNVLVKERGKLYYHVCLCVSVCIYRQLNLSVNPQALHMYVNTAAVKTAGCVYC